MRGLVQEKLNKRGKRWTDNNLTAKSLLTRHEMYDVFLCTRVVLKRRTNSRKMIIFSRLFACHSEQTMLQIKLEILPHTLHKRVPSSEIRRLISSCGNRTVSNTLNLIEHEIHPRRQGIDSAYDRLRLLGTSVLVWFRHVHQPC